MVSKGLSQAASLLALAMGTAAFVPSNIAGVRNINTNTVEQKIESCDAMLARNPGKVCLYYNRVLCIMMRALMCAELQIVSFCLSLNLFYSSSLYPIPNK